MDDREEYTPGWKFNQWELKGVPVRIEIGPRDLKQGQVVMVRRDTGQKTPVKEDDIPATAEKLLQEIQDNLFAKAKATLQEKTTTVQSYEEFKNVLCDKGGFLKAAWCGSADCEAKIKDETGATIRVRPFQREEPTTDVFTVGRLAKEIVYFARSYYEGSFYSRDTIFFECHLGSIYFFPIRMLKLQVAKNWASKLQTELQTSNTRYETSYRTLNTNKRRQKNLLPEHRRPRSL